MLKGNPSIKEIESCGTLRLLFYKYLALGEMPKFLEAIIFSCLSEARPLYLDTRPVYAELGRIEMKERQKLKKRSIYQLTG